MFLAMFGLTPLPDPAGIIPIEAELLGQDAVKVAGPMQDAIDFDPSRYGPVEDDVVLEASDGEITQVGIERLVRLVGRAHARHAGQAGEGRLGLGEETIRDPPFRLWRA